MSISTHINGAGSMRTFFLADTTRFQSSVGKRKTAREKNGHIRRKIHDDAKRLFLKIANKIKKAKKEKDHADITVSISSVSVNRELPLWVVVLAADTMMLLRRKGWKTKLVTKPVPNWHVDDEEWALKVPMYATHLIVTW